MADARFFRMTARWHLPHPRGLVFAALADADAYTTWWPQVREATRVDDRSGTARLRSVIPMSLRVTVTEQVRDATRGELRAAIEGDLVGWSRWQISDDDEHPHSAAVVDFTQEVLLHKRIPTVLIVVGRPLLRLNHRHMMRAGHRGLSRWLRDR
ncbi:SRPBCC family protein [Gordonia sp. CPCC 205515]|uniref:SRPBCC family protein n=1 Tax=Gordonia sp. CPCC 205515 TaxID=3140791 RepID=UPI003AF39C77